MSVQHRDLARGRWHNMTLVEQMAHVGSEVERAIKWREKNNSAYSVRAFERALELLDLTLETTRHASKFKEIARVRELLVDFFDGQNQYASRVESWRSYFLHFAYAARSANRVA